MLHQKESHKVFRNDARLQNIEQVREEATPWSDQIRTIEAEKRQLAEKTRA